MTTVATFAGDPKKPWSTSGRAAGRTPFHVEDGRYEVFETDKDGTYFVNDRSGPNSYIGDLAGVARFIEREKGRNR